MNFFNYKNLIISLANVFIFITIQMFFFYYIISRINIKVFEKKLIYIKPFSEKMFEKTTINKEDLKNNKNHNVNLILTRVGPILLCLFLIIIGLFILNIYRGKKWSSYEIKLLLFVILAFTTEVIIFFLVINKYDFIKMGSLFSYIFNNIDKDTKSKMVCDILFKKTLNKNKELKKKINDKDLNKSNILKNNNNIIKNSDIILEEKEENNNNNNNLNLKVNNYMSDNTYSKF